MATPKQVQKEEGKETIWHKIISLIEHGKGPTNVSMGEYLKLGEERQKGRHLGRVVVRKEEIELKVTPTAVRLALSLKKALDEATRHDEPDRLAWG